MCGLDRFRWNIPAESGLRSILASVAAVLLILAASGAALGAERLAARVTRVVDGDTIRIEYSGHSDTVRLIGIDAPESRNNRKAKKDAARSGEDMEKILEMGKAATAFMKSLIRPGDEITLQLDVQERDHYHRLLAYVYLPDGRMLNEEMVRAGYASPMTVPPNVKHAPRFQEAFREAREKGRGLWRPDL